MSLDMGGSGGSATPDDEEASCGERPEDASASDENLLVQLESVARGIGAMFPGLCEVVIHDLRTPEHAIRVIENNLSGRAVGDPITELGQARIDDPAYPAVVANYPNRFPDGRPVKSTSIGVKGEDGRYIAALCLNLDLGLLAPLAASLGNLVAVEEPSGSTALETIVSQAEQGLRRHVEDFAAQRSTTPRALNRADKQQLVRLLRDEGYFQLPDAALSIASLLGVSRATVYNYMKESS